jgi:hypothetical protein
MHSHVRRVEPAPAMHGDRAAAPIGCVQFFKGGKQQEALIGAVPKSTLVRSLEKVWPGQRASPSCEEGWHH